MAEGHSFLTLLSTPSEEEHFAALSDLPLLFFSRDWTKMGRLRDQLFLLSLDWKLTWDPFISPPTTIFISYKNVSIFSRPFIVFKKLVFLYSGPIGWAIHTRSHKGVYTRAGNDSRWRNIVSINIEETMSMDNEGTEFTYAMMQCSANLSCYQFSVIYQGWKMAFRSRNLRV